MISEGRVAHILLLMEKAKSNIEAWFVSAERVDMADDEAVGVLEAHLTDTEKVLEEALLHARLLDVPFKEEQVTRTELAERSE